MPDARLLVTPESLEAAKSDALAERQRLRDLGIWIEPDELELGIRMGNWMASALYGPRGEYRIRKPKALKVLLPADPEPEEES